ncbi:MAG: OmpA family protein [Aureispira sp.]|nr:OmpA family protein [Aureispira sp.]
MKFLNMIILGLFFFTSINISAQVNLVPNPSFEEVENLKIDPIRGSYWGGHQEFLDNLPHWSSPTKSSPDLRILTKKMYKHAKRYHPSQNCDSAHIGSNAAGIITYYPNKFDEEYREYIQVKLKTSLLIDKTYKLQFWVRRSHTARYVSNNLGILLDTESWEFANKYYKQLPAKPNFNIDTLINEKEAQWVKISIDFVADKNYTHLIIGNFKKNKNTKLKKVYDLEGYGVYDYAYYLVDDIQLIDPTAKPEILVWNEKEVKKGEQIQLDNVLFEFGKAALSPKSFTKLDELVQFLNTHKTTSIEIHGHTDLIGDASSNQKLSEQRAQTIYNYLIHKGTIDKTRLNYKGFGNSNPIADNKTEAGRKLNRRVEFVIK